MNILNIPSEETFIRVAEALEGIANNHPVVDFSNLPGSKRLIAGDKNAGFLGFVEAEEFITGADLCTSIGLSQGSIINSTTPWIKYMWKGKICFRAVKSIMRSVTWDAIYNAGAVYGTDDEGLLPPTGRLGTNLFIDGADNSINTTNQRFLGDKTFDTDYADTVARVGDTIVLKGWSNGDNNGEFTVDTITNNKIIVSGGTLTTEEGGNASRIYEKSKAVTQDAKVDINGIEGKVRLMRGAANDPTDSYGDADRGSIGEENEYNAIILPLHEHAKLQNWNYPQYAGMTEDWGIYLTDKDLVLHHVYGTGNRPWMQETSDITSWRRVIRGNSGASYLFASSSWLVYTGYGFSPVLEFPQTSTL